MLQQQQRQQASYLGFPGEQTVDDPNEPDRLVAELDLDQLTLGGRVPLVEHEVEHGEHAAEAFLQQLARGHAIGDAGVADLPLRTDQPLLHRGFGQQERAGDLSRRQATDRPQGEGHAGLHREGRVATGEDQTESLVRDLLHVISQRRERAELLGLRRLAEPDLIAAQPVDRSVASGGDDPRSRVVGDAPLRPGADRLLERFLDRLFRQVEAAGRSDQGRDRPPRLAAEQAVDVPARIDRGVSRPPSP